jgi:hypothetical protein
MTGFSKRHIIPLTHGPILADEQESGIADAVYNGLAQLMLGLEILKTSKAVLPGQAD